MSNRKLYKLDKQGNLNFGTLNRLHRNKYKADSVWNQTWVLMIIIIACMVADWFSFASLFASFLYENELLRNICIIGMVLCFEISPVYCGYNMKKKACGYNVEAISIVLPLAAFILGVIINILLRIATRDLAFPDLSNTTTSVLGGDTTESGGSSNALTYSIFFSVLPIITSLVAYSATYTMSNPLNQERQKLEKTKLELTQNMSQLESVLAEYDADENYLDRMLADDDSKFDSALSMIRNQRDEYFDYARQRINEHLASPAATGYMVEYAEKSNYKEDNNR